MFKKIPSVSVVLCTNSKLEEFEVITFDCTVYILVDDVRSLPSWVFNNHYEKKQVPMKIKEGEVQSNLR